MATIAATFPVQVADAHPGALNAAGCHNVRATGEYHCHAGAAKAGEHRRFVTFGETNDEFSSRYGVHKKR
ncbi:YHYH domain-containing protein [Methylocystis sp. JAN1]|uniref:YHYH domain-containing protein n=1 Tax=Methylocystis sp. JAN1 TaxID=3397211 RepID=UPI003FA1C5E1